MTQLIYLNFLGYCLDNSSPSLSALNENLTFSSVLDILLEKEFLVSTGDFLLRLAVREIPFIFVISLNSLLFFIIGTMTKS